jgi:hypothetical protein
MFNNTVSLESATDTNVEVALVDGPTNRKTMRSSPGGDVEFSIAHQESNENPGVPTQRTNVRVSKTFAAIDLVPSAKAYVQFTISCPKEQVSLSSLRPLVDWLLNFLVHGEEPIDEELVTTDGATNALARLYAGEP